MVTQELLTEWVKQSIDFFESAEFGYLSFTGKIENNVRDKLAFYLNEKLGSDKVCVMREWKAEDGNKSDIAVTEMNLGKQIPKVIFEIKIFMVYTACIYSISVLT